MEDMSFHMARLLTYQANSVHILYRVQKVIALFNAKS